MQRSVEDALSQGLFAHKEGNLERAEVCYREVLQCDARNPEANHNLGLIYVLSGMFDLALPLLKIAKDVNPNVEQFWVTYIDALTKNKYFKVAEEVLLDAENQGLTGEQLSILKENLSIEASSENVVVSGPSDEIQSILIGHFESRRFEQAERLASSLTLSFPNHAFAWKILGAVLKATGRVSDALPAGEKAVECNPGDADAHFNLSNTFRELGRLGEAEAYMRHAIILKPNFTEAFNNLGLILTDVGRLDEAEECYKSALVLKPADVEVMFNLSIAQSYKNDLESEIASLENIMAIDSGGYSFRAGVNLAICKFLRDDFKGSKDCLLKASDIQKMRLPIHQNEKVFSKLLLKLLSWHEEHPIDNGSQKFNKLYVIGEAHSLVSHGLRIQNLGDDFLCISKLIKGCTQYKLGDSTYNKYKYQFEDIFGCLPLSSTILIAIGEIDCRLNRGIFSNSRKSKDENLTEIIDNTVVKYLTYIANLNRQFQHHIIVQGVPCPNINPSNVPRDDMDYLVKVINEFNRALKSFSMENGFRFLDVHKLTDGSNGVTNRLWHIDNRHLTPNGMLEAWSSCI